MRLKILIGVPLIAAGLLSVVFFAPRPEPAAPAHNDAPMTEPIPAPPGTRLSARPQASAPTPAPVMAGVTNQAHAVYAHGRIGELETLAMNNDTASRDTILSELQNPDKAIRHAALQAAIQFGDRSIVPHLQELAGQTEDADEKAEIISAMEYLKLPSITEYLAANPRTGPANPPRSHTNHTGWGTRSH